MVVAQTYALESHYTQDLPSSPFINPVFEHPLSQVATELAQLVHTKFFGT